MKTRFLLAAMLLGAATAMAKDIKTAVFTTQPQMHCESCENKIKNNMRFEKGIKRIETDIPNQAVTITYDADKTNVGAIIEGFKKIDYTATVKTECAEKTCEAGVRQCPAQQKKANAQGGCCTVK